MYYRHIQYHYFLFDLCYFVNVLCLVYIWVFPTSQLLFMSIFALSNGPLAWAIVAWRNSMVFHSVDKITSILIHLGPPILCASLRHVSKETLFHFLSICTEGHLIRLRLLKRVFIVLQVHDVYSAQSLRFLLCSHYRLLHWQHTSFGNYST